jgi:hypothetical protein
MDMKETNMEETTQEQVDQELHTPPGDTAPTQEQLEKEMSCQHCHSKLVSKPELTGAVQFIHLHLPVFRQAMSKVTGVQAKAVLEAIVESPLEKDIKGFTTKEAMRLFELGIAINSAKYVLFQGSKNHYDELAQDVAAEMDKSEANGEAPATEENNSPQTTEGN